MIKKRKYNITLHPRINTDIYVENRFLTIQTIKKGYFNYLAHKRKIKFVYHITLRSLPIRFQIACEEFNNGMNVKIPMNFIPLCDGYLVAEDRGYQIETLHDISHYYSIFTSLMKLPICNEITNL